jgi:hypothetical protein
MTNDSEPQAHEDRRTEMCLQVAVADWHKRRFPQAKTGHVMLKVMAECGEVADALSGEEDPRTTSTGDGDVLAEAADTVLALLVLIGRFYPGADLLGAVWAKLAILSDPDGVHRSLIGAM